MESTPTMRAIQDGVKISPEEIIALDNTDDNNDTETDSDEESIFEQRQLLAQERQVLAQQRQLLAQQRQLLARERQLLAQHQLLVQEQLEKEQVRAQANAVLDSSAELASKNAERANKKRSCAKAGARIRKKIRQSKSPVEPAVKSPEWPCNLILYGRHKWCENFARVLDKTHITLWCRDENGKADVKDLIKQFEHACINGRWPAGKTAGKRETEFSYCRSPVWKYPRKTYHGAEGLLDFLKQHHQGLKNDTLMKAITAWNSK